MLLLQCWNNILTSTDRLLSTYSTFSKSDGPLAERQETKNFVETQANDIATARKISISSENTASQQPLPSLPACLLHSSGDSGWQQKVFRLNFVLPCGGIERGQRGLWSRPFLHWVDPWCLGHKQLHQTSGNQTRLQNLNAKTHSRWAPMGLPDQVPPFPGTGRRYCDLQELKGTSPLMVRGSAFSRSGGCHKHQSPEGEKHHRLPHSPGVDETSVTMAEAISLTPREKCSLFSKELNHILIMKVYLWDLTQF